MKYLPHGRRGNLETNTLMGGRWHGLSVGRGRTAQLLQLAYPPLLLYLFKCQLVGYEDGSKKEEKDERAGKVELEKDFQHFKVRDERHVYK